MHYIMKKLSFLKALILSLILLFSGSALAGGKTAAPTTSDPNPVVKPVDPKPDNYSKGVWDG